MNSYFSEGYAKLLMSLTLVAAVIALISYAVANFEYVHTSEYEATISVEGEGEVFAVPDVGQFTFSVVAESDSAEGAQEASGVVVNDILAYLSDQGIEDKDIKTQSYNMYPKYDWVVQEFCTEVFCDRERVQDGFEVSQRVSVKVRNTDEAGAIIAGVGERGATNISQINFIIDDMDALRAEARELAIDDAKEKAKRLAKDLGVDLKRIVSFYEDGGNYYEPYYEARAFSLDFAEEASFGGPELPVGEESTKVSVNITYEIR